MLQVYTGEGKGKTTAALGLALRALGAGKRVHMIQFVKGMAYSELEPLKSFENFTMDLCGRDCFIEKKPQQEDIDLARRGLEKFKNYLKEESFDLVILDEVHIALYFGLFQLGELMDLLDKAGKTEIVTTGRYAPRELLERADLVTEMRELKHYYQRGQKARKGIEY